MDKEGYLFSKSKYFINSFPKNIPIILNKVKIIRIKIRICKIADSSKSGQTPSKNLVNDSILIVVSDSETKEFELPPLDEVTSLLNSV